MIKVFIYSCLLLVFLINCKSNIPEARNKTDYSQITHYSSRSAHPISSVNFDTIRIDAGNENEMTSLLGSFLFLGDTLCFADREQSTLFLYDRDGRFLGTHLSYGRGPQEIWPGRGDCTKGRRFPSERRAEQGNRRRLQEGRSYHD